MAEKSWFVTPEGDLLNFDFISRIQVGADVGVNDDKLFIILGTNLGDGTTSGSNAIITYDYADNAAALAALAKYTSLLDAQGRVTRMT